MCSERKSIDMGFTHEHFNEGTHICLIYSSEEERKKVIARFIESGLATGEKVAYFSDAVTPSDIHRWLHEKGIDIAEAESSGQMVVSCTDQIYHPTGTFFPDEMIETLKNFYRTATMDHYPSTRVSGEMSWALKGVPGSDRLMEYESKVNEVVVDFPVTAICQYDANKFDGATILECLKVHPYMIVYGQIVRNPYFMSTVEYLKTISHSPN